MTLVDIALIDRRKGMELESKQILSDIKHEKREIYVFDADADLEENETEKVKKVFLNPWGLLFQKKFER